MVLHKLEEFYPNYREELFDGEDIKGLDVYARRTGEKIGSIATVLVDRQGRFRYFIINTGFWIFGKKFLLPVDYCQVSVQARRIYATGILNKKQVEVLPEYNSRTRINRSYEERLTEAYHKSAIQYAYKSAVPVEASVPLETSASLDRAYTPSRSGGILTSAMNYAGRDRHTYNYQQGVSVDDLNGRAPTTTKLYEERLVANKRRRQTGEVVVSKQVQTEKARVSLPLKKERVVIERTNPTTSRNIASLSNFEFREGELARMKVYEETPDIHKEAFVREEVKIKKEVKRDTVQAEETVRREMLDIDSEGHQVVDRRIDRR